MRTSRRLDKPVTLIALLTAAAGNCRQSHVRNFRPHDNSKYNNLRFEDVWLDK